MCMVQPDTSPRWSRTPRNLCVLKTAFLGPAIQVRSTRLLPALLRTFDNLEPAGWRSTADLSSNKIIMHESHMQMGILEDQ